MLVKTVTEFMSDYQNVSCVYLETAFCNRTAPSTTLHLNCERRERLTLSGFMER